jgi:hypothetical protein
VELKDQKETLYFDKQIEVIESKLHINGELAETLDLTLPIVTLQLKITSDAYN